MVIKLIETLVAAIRQLKIANINATSVDIMITVMLNFTVSGKKKKNKGEKIFKIRAYLNRNDHYR